MQISAVVQERELKLRQAMRTMGMLDSAFWLTWATYEIVMGFVTAMLLAGFGAMWQVRAWPKGDVGVVNSIAIESRASVLGVLSVECMALPPRTAEH